MGAGGAAPVRAQQVSVERLELTVRIDPARQSLYVKATYHLRASRRRESIDFRLPAAVAPYMDFRRVWDRSGELSWRFLMGDDRPRAVRVYLREPLKPREPLVLVVSYDLNLKAASGPVRSVVVEAERAQLATTGWYPLPAASGARLPLVLRLAVHVPKEWPVEAPGALKKIFDGTTLAGYELELRQPRPGKLLFRAGRTLP
ncbi:MAG: hypothetical protein ACE5G6_05400 [Terriglobia bacterium]